MNPATRALHQEVVDETWAAIQEQQKYQGPRGMTVAEVMYAASQVEGVMPYGGPGGIVSSNISSPFDEDIWFREPIPGDGGPIQPGGPSITLGKTVDVYMSAGPNDGAGSCDQVEESNCEIYRLRIVLPNSGPGGMGPELQTLEVERVASASLAEYNAVQPAISPSGDRLAWVSRTHSYSFLKAKSLSSGVTTVVAEAGKAVRDAFLKKPNFPNWYDGDTLLYTAGEQGANTLYSAGVNDATTLKFDFPVGRLGAASDTAILQTMMFADANTSPNGRDIVTFGSSDADGLLKPRVHALDPVRLPGGGWATEEFELSETYYEKITGTPLRSRRQTCQHPAWNITGDEILCSALEPAEPFPPDNPRPNSTTGMLYLYRQKTTFGWRHWTSEAELVFTPLTPDKVEDQFDYAFPEGALIYVYKLAEWCGTDNYVICTLYSKNADGPTEEIQGCRVMLIQRSPVQYYDLTALVEQHFGADLGAWRGIYSTCARNLEGTQR